MKLNTKFNKLSLEFFSLNTTLELKNLFKSDDICKLEKKFYPKNFTDQDIVTLEYELIHYKFDVMHKFKVFPLVELCQQLTKIERSKVYLMLTKFIHLIFNITCFYCHCGMSIFINEICENNIL